MDPHPQTTGDLKRSAAAVMPPVAFWSLRLVETEEQVLRVRQGVLQPPSYRSTSGIFVSVIEGRGMGYAATPDTTPAGLRAAAGQARDWARRVGSLGLTGLGLTHLGLTHLGRTPGGPVAGAPFSLAYRSPVESPWQRAPLAETIGLLHHAARRLKCHARIVDWETGLHLRTTRTLLVTSAGGEIDQVFSDITADLMALAHHGNLSERRSFGGDCGRQGGVEVLEGLGFTSVAGRVAEEALILVDAPPCPSGRMDLLLLPSQMILQVHESIGHPLELDRILGDERNYAGGTFVTPEMFGTYRYGSELLDVTYDPGVPGELASFAADDEGTHAERQYLIRAGVLERPLGGTGSQIRAGLPGVACTRAEGWHRPPIDRMANVNLEPGATPFEDLVRGIERGVLMDTNRSWSIDDRRNKFQFGCEFGALIRDGEVRDTVRNPGYRGVSANFWRGLAAVGDRSTWRVMGLSTCGKGEPNQTTHVGHAAPACVFRDVEVFGGG
ncbi:MAG: TldD/PmbA family protein [Gammaproteobacteria bacterium]